MTSAASTTVTGGTESDPVIVLVAPEALGPSPDWAKVKQTLDGTTVPFRVLVSLTEAPDAALLAALQPFGARTQILLAPGMSKPEIDVEFQQNALPGTSPNDQNEFALALADVLIAPESNKSLLKVLASDLKKSVIEPGNPAERPAAFQSVTHRLDPEAPGWHRWGWWLFGRMEQLITEVLAFAWRGWTVKSIAKSGGRLFECCWAWWPKTYFPPGKSPDTSLLDPELRIVTRFEAMDRSALYGSYVHRDLTWVAHFGAGFAVLAAVMGALDHEHPTRWGVVELVVLGAVAALVLLARQGSLQDRWTACRLGAEQLRIARLSLPLLVLPRAWATEDERPKDDKNDYEFNALTEVKRIVRDHGLPRLDGITLKDAAKWVDLIVSDQIAYHHSNEHKLEAVERRMLYLTSTIFFASVLAVVYHFRSHENWLLVLTAAGPAFAAAIHGAGTRLGIVHRAQLSAKVEHTLKEIQEKLVPHLDGPDSVDAWKEVRQLTYRAADAMGSENTSWHGLVRRYKDELPA